MMTENNVALDEQPVAAAKSGRRKKEKQLNLLHRPMDPRNPRDKTLRLVQLAVLVAISSVLVLLSFPLLPAVAFMEYDLADIPVLLCAFTMGTPAGLLVLAIAAAIQAFVFGHNGLIGFIMHMISSSIWVLVAGGIYSLFKRSTKGMIAGLVCGIVVVVLVMIPLNFIFIPMLMNADLSIAETAGTFWHGMFGGIAPGAYSEAAVAMHDTVEGLLWIGIVPFNLIKWTLHSVIFVILYRSLPFLRRHNA